MNIHELWDRALFYLSVPECVSCKTKLDYGVLALCPECYSVYKKIASRNCSRCAKLLSECTCPGELLDKNRVRTVVKLFRYISREENICANSLIYSLKRDNRKDVLEFCVKEMVAPLKNAFSSFENVVFTNVPRRRSAIIKYGMDHAGLLAKTLAEEVGASYMSLLKSKSRKAQKSLRRDERIENTRFVLRSKTGQLNGKTVVVIDDVITSGASVVEAARVIRDLHPKKIAAAAIAIAYKDMYTPPLFTYY